jgi:hypothetical protein
MLCQTNKDIDQLSVIGQVVSELFARLPNKQKEFRMHVHALSSNFEAS